MEEYPDGAVVSLDPTDYPEYTVTILVLMRAPDKFAAMHSAAVMLEDRDVFYGFDVMNAERTDEV